MADKQPDHYHAWICDKGHTHTDLKLETIFQDVSATPIALALSRQINRKPKDKPKS